MKPFVISGVSHGSNVVALYERLRIKKGWSVLQYVIAGIAKFIVKPSPVDQEN